MTGSLQMTRESFVRAVKRGNVREPELSVVVVRLLAVALMVTSRRTHRSHLPGLAVPKAYRAWPLISSEVESSGGRQQLRFYVGSKGAYTADDEGFPVGTALVVETYDLSRSTGLLTGMPEKNGHSLRSVFAMEKYASMSSSGVAAGQREAWAYATYGPDGVVLGTDSTACGVCRLPFMYV